MKQMTKRQMQLRDLALYEPVSSGLLRNIDADLMDSNATKIASIIEGIETSMKTSYDITSSKQIIDTALRIIISGDDSLQMEETAIASVAAERFIQSLFHQVALKYKFFKK